MRKPVHSIEQLKEYLHKNYPSPTPNINFGSEYQIAVGPEGIKLLVSYLEWNIEKLNISMHAVKDQGFQILLNEEIRKQENSWTNLRELASIKNELTSEGLKGIEKVYWPNLEGLILNDNKIDHRGIDLLIKTTFSKSLKKLFLGNNNIGIAGCEILSRSQWPNFQRLGLTYNFISNEGLAYLHLANWPKLLQLNLSNNKLDARGMVYLQKGNWPLLQIINLSRNKIGYINESQLTDIGCFYISKLKSKSIKNFGVFGNDISLNGIRTIFRSSIFVPNCFLQLTKNLFTFEQIRLYLHQYNLFCNEFDD